MKKTLLSSARLALGLLALSSAAAFAAGPAPAPAAAALPVPKILIIDRSAILQATKVGQDIARQMQAFQNQAKNDMAAQGKALQAEGQALQQQVAILSGDAKQKKIDAFEQKQQALQLQAQRKEQQMQYTFLKAQQTVSQALQPIVNSLMQQRGANMLLDRTAVMAINGDARQFDITPQAIDQLNQKMPSIKLTLENPPAGMAAPAPAK